MHFSHSSKQKAFAASLMACALAALPSIGAAQRTTNTAALYNIQRNSISSSFSQKLMGEQRARQLRMPVSGKFRGGSFAVVGYDRGLPVYYITDNRKAADTISTDEVWSGGSAGLSLNGSGVNMAVWDGGRVRGTHQEFSGGRVTYGDTASFSDHGTHVAGTMVAGGTNPLAKGMSFAGRLKSYDWNSDTAEMAAAAASGMLVSNHSYGLITGWTMFEQWYWYGDAALSETEDWKFGRYDNTARDWDDIAYNAPYYLICKSAGNDRGEGPALADQPTGLYFNGTSWVANDKVRNLDGGALGYDSISAYAVAKNIMTVGAIEPINGGYTNPASVVMSSFSCWGPADDGRIKPDIVADGVNMISSTAGSDTEYSSYSGTSMATPSVSGSLALLQQHYSDTHSGEFMRSATLKALAIHTADEAGSANGPDYSFGWGLMNTKNAALLISRDVSSPDTINEENLLNGNTFAYTVNSDGTEPLKVTIAWTDPKGIPQTPNSNNPTKKMLVNDLDIRVTGNNSTFMPWILDPANPAAPATKGDNNRDNVEQIVIPNPAPGTYTITVTHKGTLVGNGQAFSMILAGGGGAAGGAMTCTSVNTMTGTYLGGNLGSVADSDNNYYITRSSTVARVGEYTNVEFEFDNPSGKTSSLSVSIEAIAQGGTRVTGSVFFYNYTTGQYDFIRSYNLPTNGNDTIATRITQGAAKYVSGAKKVKVLFRSHEPIRTLLGKPAVHTLRIDKISLN